VVLILCKVVTSQLSLSKGCCLFIYTRLDLSCCCELLWGSEHCFDALTDGQFGMMQHVSIKWTWALTPWVIDHVRLALKGAAAQARMVAVGVFTWLEEKHIVFFLGPSSAFEVTGLLMITSTADSCTFSTDNTLLHQYPKRLFLKAFQSYQFWMRYILA